MIAIRLPLATAVLTAGVPGDNASSRGRHPADLVSDRHPTLLKIQR